MGYFSNGTERMIYQEEYCTRCVHDINEDCAVWSTHILHNYKERNKKDSILHILIPRKGIQNEKCRMFWERK